MLFLNIQLIFISIFFSFFRKKLPIVVYFSPSVCHAVRLSVRPSVSIISFRGILISNRVNRPIDLKIGLNGLKWRDFLKF